MFREAGPRIDKLRDNILAAEPTVGLERARIVTESDRRNEGKSILLKRAEALRDVLDQQTVFINGRRLTGRQPEPRLALSAGLSGKLRRLDGRRSRDDQNGDPPGQPPPHTREIWSELGEIAAYWQGKTLVEKCYARFPDEVLAARQAMVFSVSLEKNATGHCVLDYPTLLHGGYQGVREKTAGDWPI